MKILYVYGMKKIQSPRYNFDGSPDDGYPSSGCVKLFLAAVAFFVVLLLAGCKPQANQDPHTGLELKPVASGNLPGNVETFKYRGHEFLCNKYTSNKDIIHAPYCPCFYEVNPKQ